MNEKFDCQLFCLQLLPSHIIINTPKCFVPQQKGDPNNPKTGALTNVLIYSLYMYIAQYPQGGQTSDNRCCFMYERGKLAVIDNKLQCEIHRKKNKVIIVLKMLKSSFLLIDERIIQVIVLI